MATPVFENVCAPPVQLGENATVSGKLLQEAGGQPASDEKVSVTIGGDLDQTLTATTNAFGEFRVSFDSSSAGSYPVTVTGPDGVSTQTTLIVYPVPSTAPCDPCTDLITAAKRVLRDPKVNQGIGNWLLGAASEQKNPVGAAALTSLANAVAGKDALPAKAECCGGALRVFFEFEDAVTSKRTPMDPQVFRQIEARLVDRRGNLTGHVPTYDRTSVLFPSVEQGAISLALAANIGESAEILNEYYFKSVNDQDFRQRVRGKAPQQNEKASANTQQGSTSTDPENTTVGNTATNTAAGKKKPGVMEEMKEGAKKVIDDAEELFRRKKSATETAEAAEADTASPEAKAPPKDSDTKYTPTFEAFITAGTEAWMKIIFRPVAAHVRCFSSIEGDDCCGQGKQYISRVAIQAMQGENPVKCMPTGESGCAGFNLNPGWYQFWAPEEIMVRGCNYMLASASPVSAFLGNGQGSSDIYFSYKKKGCEVNVISQICFPDTTDPNKEVYENFGGVTYLLVREDDLSFTQQQTTAANGAPISFQNLPAATYLIFPQGPATYNGLPVELKFPERGHLALRVFGGQKGSSIPVLVKFRQGTTSAPVLQGTVTDDTGQPVPGQLVQARNCLGALMAAGLTNSSGQYSFPIYTIEDVTLIVGTQQIAVSKAQLQADTTTVPAPLPSPYKELQPQLQAAELVGVRA